MVDGLSFVTIPDESYYDYKVEVIFNAFKWDSQVYDTNTVSRHILLVDAPLADELARLAEKLSEETLGIEEALMERPELARDLAIPRNVRKCLRSIAGYKRADHVRLMRFDFHPTDEGWVVSEVNSDVPAGMAEASILHRMANRFCPDCEPRGDVVEAIYNAYAPLIPPQGRIAFVHATSFVEDFQMVACIADYFKERGYEAVFAAPNQLAFEGGKVGRALGLGESGKVGRRGKAVGLGDGGESYADAKAVSLVEGERGKINGIIRYFPVEWLRNYRFSDWKGYFKTTLPQCNHPIALYSQSKRLPLVLGKLGVPCPTWERLLPETETARFMREPREGFIYKPALGRVGDGVTIREAMTPKAYKKAVSNAKRWPRHWVTQRRFGSATVAADNGEAFHLCMGVFTVNAKFAGFYARTSVLPRIDDKAIDTPVLVRK